MKTKIEKNRDAKQNFDLQAKNNLEDELINYMEKKKRKKNDSKNRQKGRLRKENG